MIAYQNIHTIQPYPLFTDHHPTCDKVHDFSPDMKFTGSKVK